MAIKAELVAGILEDYLEIAAYRELERDFNAAIRAGIPGNLIRAITKYCQIVSFDWDVDISEADPKEAQQWLYVEIKARCLRAMLQGRYVSLNRDIYWLGENEELDDEDDSADDCEDEEDFEECSVEVDSCAECMVYLRFEEQYDDKTMPGDLGCPVVKLFCVLERIFKERDAIDFTLQDKMPGVILNIICPN